MNTNKWKSLPVFKEYRCYATKRLLCKATWHGQIEVMNPENRVMNYVWPSRISQDIWPKWQEFLNYSVDLNCAECKRLLCRASWTDLVVEIKCQYCHKVNVISVEELENKKLAPLSQSQRDNIIAKKTQFRAK